MIPSKALEKIFEKNTQWIDIVKSFGCNRDTSQDIVQEMYFKVQKRLDKGTDIQYSEDDINYYYIFKVLRSLFLDLKRKESKVVIFNIEDRPSYFNDYDVNYDFAYEKVKKELSKLYWYDRKVYSLLDGNESVAKLSRKTNISYHSLYNTYRRVLDKLKKVL